MRLAALIAGLVAASLAAAGSNAATTPPITIDRWVDHTRVAHFRTGATVSRTLITYVRRPTTGRPPYPLVVFAHGFATTPGVYAPLLDAWARAGYLVAAPLFPVESANAPGGPNEDDLINQPADVSFVISRMLAASSNPTSALYHLVDRHRIAVAGQSDGGETAFAVAYERSYRDPRVTACVVLSGARLPGEPLVGGRRPPLLAVQGTADTINRPSLTSELFRDTGRPRFLLWLLHAGHLPPYTTSARELRVVERVTEAFLATYLGQASPGRIARAARAPGVARLVADP